ncbi:unnamed protein product [Urochloa decumbens]|uniref:Disease resistance protein At4g27190-like leucine-rich repeats domain-containing protein n=1 Tax=Urochloa decumbens TaxID=240449 RepID=A0ABC9D6V8_9POAL
MGEAKLKYIGPFDCIIKVDLKHSVALPWRLDIKEKLSIKVAEELGLLSQEDDEISYYSYGLEDATGSLRNRLASLVPQINQKLIGKKYLLVVENLYEPIESVDFSMKVGFPPRSWNDSRWIISTTSHDVYDRSKPDDGSVIDSFSGDDILMLTVYSLHQAAMYILGVTRHKDEQYWHHVAVCCFHYATMLLIPHCSAAHGDGDQHSSDAPNDITSDELIRQWAAQGLITVIQDRKEEVTSTSYHDKYSDIYQVGNAILEAFREYSLLQLPFSPTAKADEAIKSAAHFLACHNLVVECHTTEELCEDNHPGREHMQWISHVGDQGWHVRREWLNHVSSGPSSLIIRHCSQQSRLFAKLDHLLAKLPCLRVLDLSYTQIKALPPSVSCLQQLQLLYLSYTPLESLPFSIYCLQKLQLLSLRGCYNDLKSPFSFSCNKVIVPENNTNKKINVLQLDLSYSNINTFHCEFFHHMPNIQELLLVKCSNLEELPPSIVALSSLTTLELTGTQIESFSWEMFEEMKTFRSLKLIDNKILLFVIPRLVSKLCGLIDLHIEGCESMTEVDVTLERHPALRSFTLIGAPHMRRLSLRGCKMLEHVDIKEVYALEELELSSTAIKELPDNIPNLPHLRQLLLMGVPSLRRFPWHKLQRLPSVFCLDHFSERTTNHSNPQVAHVCINDSRLFYSFNLYVRNLVRGGQILKSFYVQVTSCNATARKIQYEVDTVNTNKLQKAQTAYADVNRRYMTEGVSMVSMDDVPPIRETERHVEISAADRYPHGLGCLLQVTKSTSMSDDAHVSCLTDLGYLDNELEECKLQRCHQMKIVFKYCVGTLRHTCASHLKSLTHFYSGSVGFPALVHLRLEYCPRLEGVISRASKLPSLVTLDIRFCYNLKAIYYKSNESSVDYYQLPRLRRIRLQELPLLEHLYVDDTTSTTYAPKWEELHVRGCWSLRRLPRLDKQPANKAVKVSGERAWWSKLRWDDDGAPSHSGSYEPRLPPASASIRERVVIRTYLR